MLRIINFYVVRLTKNGEVFDSSVNAKSALQAINKSKKEFPKVVGLLIFKSHEDFFFKEKILASWFDKEYLLSEIDHEII
jgi:hypothetical protein